MSVFLASNAIARSKKYPNNPLCISQVLYPTTTTSESRPQIFVRFVTSKIHSIGNKPVHFYKKENELLLLLLVIVIQWI